MPTVKHERPVRIVHFVYGGLTGSTLRAIDLAIFSQRRGQFDNAIVFRDAGNAAWLRERLLGTGITARMINRKNTGIARYIYRLSREFKELQPEIVLCHGSLEHIHGRVSAILSRIPIIIQVEHCVERYRFIHYILTLLLAPFTQAIICVSGSVREHLARLGLPRNKLTVIHNGLDLGPFVPSIPKDFKARGLTVLMVGRFCGQKDQPTLIEAVTLLNKDNIRCQLTLIGEDQSGTRDTLEGFATECLPVECIQFLDWRDDLTPYLWNSAIFVLSTNYEGLPSVIIEAFASRCLVIASDVPGVSDLIQHGRTGFLFPHGDARSLADQIKYAFENTRSANAVAGAGQSYALTHFTIEKMTDNYSMCLLNLKPFYEKSLQHGHLET